VGCHTGAVAEATAPSEDPAQDGGRGARRAQAPLDLVQDFVNTRNLMRGTDSLADPVAAQAWLPAPPRGRDDDQQLSELRDLRETLRRVLLTHTTQEPVEAQAVSRLQQLSAPSELATGVAVDGSCFVQPRRHDDTVSRVFAAIVEASLNGTWPRLKACANPDCRWVFYDTSRNHSGAWCVMSICGSREKMRSYRQRRTDPATPTHAVPG